MAVSVCQSFQQTRKNTTTRDKIRLLVQKVCAERLRIRAQVCQRLTDTALDALGEDVLSAPHVYRNPISGKEEYRHALVQALHSQEIPEIGVSQLLEVGAYITSFAADPSLNDCVVALRNPRQYESAFFQLAVGHRLSLAGCSNMMLEPPTQRGKADLAFTYLGRRYVVECYRLNQFYHTGILNYRITFARSLFELVPRSKKYSFRLELLVMPSFDTIRRIRDACRRLVGDMSRTRQTQVSVEAQRFSLAVEDISNIYPDPDFPAGVAPGTTPPQRLRENEEFILEDLIETEGFFDMKLPNGNKCSPKSRLFYLDPNHEGGIADPYRILEKRISRKLSQTATEETSAGRLLFVEFQLGLRDSDGKETQGKIQDRIRRLFERVSGIFILERRLGASNRFIYDSIFIRGNLEWTVPDGLLSRLNQVEKSDIFCVV